MLKGIGGIVVALVVIGYLYGANGSNGNDPSAPISSDSGSTVSLSDVHLGESLHDVIGQLGPPDDRQHTESAYAGIKSVNDCLYYGSLQFCFDNGKLTSKSKY